MTREEAIEMLNYIKRIGNGESSYKNCAQSIALDMAISALSENKGDLISRQAVINAIANTCFWLSADNWEELTKCINSIPSVENKGEFDGMTNGEVIQEIYRFHSDMNCGSNGEYVHIWSDDGNCQMTIHKDFWNAPYQKGGE